MKIFNWVHRRFIPKDGLGQNHVKKDEEMLNNNNHADTAALLEKVIVPADLLQFHGWGAGAGAGILSIGTFGLKDNFSTNQIHNEYFGLMPKDDQDDMLSEDDEYYSQSHLEDEDDESEDDSSSDEGEEDCEQEWNPLVYDKSGASRPHARIVIDATKLLRPNNLQLLDQHDYDNNYKMNKMKKQRITLADLFSADSDDGINRAAKDRNNYCKPATPSSQCTKKTTTTTATTLPAPDRAPKNGTLFPKKLISRVKEDSRPIQKLHGLMKRMLKRKIHPDVVEGKIKPCAAGNGIPSVDDYFGINESVSLLQSQDACHL